MTELITQVMLTLLLHGALFLSLAWLVEALGWVRRPAAREFLWRSAVLAGFGSALLQLLLAAWQPHAAVTPLLRVGLDLHDAAAVSQQRDAGSARDEGASTLAVVPAAAAGAEAAAPRQSRSAAQRSAAQTRSSMQSQASQEQQPLPARLRALVLAALPWLLAAWLAGTLAAWLRLALAAGALRRLQRSALLLEAQDWQDDAAALARGLAVAVPELRVSPAIASPLATPGGSVLLPVWALPLPAAQRQALLVHELSHLARRDPLWRVGLALWRGLLWPLPLSALVLRRLETLAELECDAAAARALGDGRPLAECLAQCLAQRAGSRFPAFAVAMAAPRSPLLQRAERLLEGVSMSAHPIPLRARLAPLAALLVAALAVPAFVQQPASAKQTSESRISVDGSGDCAALAGNCTSIHSHNGDSTVTMASPGRRLQFKSNGVVRFRDDGIDSLEPGARASIEETTPAGTRRVEYSNAGGALQLSYWRDGKAQDMDAEAKAWLAALLPQLLREAAIDVEGRVARLHQRGGARAVTADIALIHSDYSRGRHLGELLRKYKLDGTELDLALAQAARIGSDYERRQVLSAALDSQQVEKPQLIKVFEAAEGIGSDYERAELLEQSATRVKGDAQLRRAWLKLAAELGSDYERRRSLQSLVTQTGDGDDPALREILAAGDGIGSDYEHRELLTGVAGKIRDAEAIAPDYARAASTIGSDFERREALVALLRGGRLQRAGALAVLESAAGIGSDFECRTVLVELARVMPDDPAVRARLIEVAGRLSDFERRQVEEAAGLVSG
jgi:beta-lactamase regulating signal transducer with metallopeptidase domain